MSVDRIRLGDDRGASAVEFALLAPVLLMFLFGVFQLGWGLHCGSSVRWALENNARTLLLAPTTTQSDLQTAVRANLADVPNANSVTVTLVTDTSGAAKVLRASAAYAYPLSIPFLPTYNLTFNDSVAVPAP